MKHPCPRCERVREIERGAENNICWGCRQADERERCAKINANIEAKKLIPRNPYPKVCSMVGVHPDQLPEARKFLAERGVEPTFNEEGDFCPQSRKHLMKYGDVMGTPFQGQ